MELKNIKALKPKKKSASVMEIYGNSEIVIDGCKGVSDYSESFIKLDLGGRCVKISGASLTVCSYIYEQADIKGEIVSLEFDDD